MTFQLGNDPPNNNIDQHSTQFLTDTVIENIDY
jgi:hypothetical protein